MSLIAAIPHKSRDYKLILNLAFGAKIDGKIKLLANEMLKNQHLGNHFITSELSYKGSHRRGSKRINISQLSFY